MKKMENKAKGTAARRLGGGLILVALLLGAALPAAAAHAPAWVDTVKDVTVPKFPGNPTAVVLYTSEWITVDANGKEENTTEVVYRILRPKGVDAVSTMVWQFNHSDPVRSIEAWGVPAQGKVIDLKKGDAVEVSPFDFELYADQKELTLNIPNMHVGDIVAYEWRQQGRPEVLQDQWGFQNSFPVLHTELHLQLPEGWEYRTAWVRHAPVAPVAGDGELTWELNNVPAVEDEPSMPNWDAVAGWMGLTYLAPGRSPEETPAGRSWQEVATWAAGLFAPQMQPDPAIQAEVAKLTAGKTSMLDKIQTVASFVQHQVRYVAIEIGIGGYRPHPAASVYANLYGDCKDKATLLHAMLQVLGVRSWPVLVNDDRGSVAPSFPSMTDFDHVILAIALPNDPEDAGLFAVKNDPDFGKILFFDPTSEITSFGSLPTYEQDGDVLMVDAVHGKLVTLPTLPPAVNRLLRVGNFRLYPNGTLAGAVRELRWGSPAVDEREEMQGKTQAQQTRDMENFLSAFFTNVQLQGETVTEQDPSLSLQYALVAPEFASQAGNLLLVRPCVLGEKAEALRTDRPRQYPVSFDSTSLQTDQFTISLPPGYTVDELPPPVDVDDGFAAYHSKVTLSGPPNAQVLTFSRTWEVKALTVPVAKFKTLTHLFGVIEHAERERVVLEQAAPTGPATTSAPTIGG